MKHEDDYPAVHFELPSRFEVLEQLVDEAQCFFGAHVSDEDLLYRIVLLASEAATNAIEHGNRLDPSLNLRVDFSVQPNLATVMVEDQGGGFDMDAIRDPLESENLLSDRGRGIFLIQELADRVQWENGGRRVRIYVDLPGA